MVRHVGVIAETAQEVAVMYAGRIIEQASTTTVAVVLTACG